MTFHAQISERWRLAGEKYLHSAHSTVPVIRGIMPEDMAGRTDDDIMERLYNEDDALLDFLQAGFLWLQKMIGFISPSTRTLWQPRRIFSSLRFTVSSSQLVPCRPCFGF
jgi:hypothetical protein